MEDHPIVGKFIFLDDFPQEVEIRGEQKRYTYTFSKLENFDTEGDSIYNEYYRQCLQLVDEGGHDAVEYSQKEFKDYQMREAYTVKYMIENGHTYRECIMTLQSGQSGVDKDLTREGKLARESGGNGNTL